MKSILCVLILFIGMSLVTGCSSAPITISIESEPDANEQRPFYVVVRSIDKVTYLVEDYQTVTTKVFQTPPDPSILVSEPIHPGEDKDIVLEEEKTKTPLALYFLFTNPGDRWKTFLPAPVEADVCIELGKNQIKSQD